MSKDNLLSRLDYSFVVLNTKSKNLHIRSMETLYETTRELIYHGNFIKSLDLEVFRTLGLSNCTIVDRNKDDSVTVEIDLTDSNYTKKDSKLYQRLQLSLSKISPTTVILCSEASNGIDYGQLKELLEKTSSEFKISQCNSRFQHARVYIGSKQENSNNSLKAQPIFSLKHLNDNLNLLKEPSDTQVCRKKRRKVETLKPDLDYKLETLEKNRDVLVKIFNAVKKNSTKNEQTVKNMIHELNKKNVHPDSEDIKEENTPLGNILGFIDNLSLQSLKDSAPDSDTSLETFELLKVNNGIISKDIVYNLFKKSCEVLLRETDVFIMSLYMLSEKKMCSEPLVQVRSNSGSYVHVVCSKFAHQDELMVLFLQSS
ncbi:hypothetical protein MACJ_000842 [Theileria orientalis]|uniref:Uncharacterized protein n=1 Tax=Theileria orientalis TaxID=68886 RepID=A0A976M4R9_THEOR|nr:hypothetical protein MACJ_000842 [Theileria orientalis]